MSPKVQIETREERNHDVEKYFIHFENQLAVTALIHSSLFASELPQFTQQTFMSTSRSYARL